MRNGVEHLGSAGGVVVLLRLGKLGAVDQSEWASGQLDLVGRLDEVLERVLEVVRLVDHVRERQAAGRRLVEQLEQDQEELVRV